MTDSAPITPEGRRAIADIAERLDLSQEAVLSMLFALRAGGGTMAQFSIPELGGSGQWMRGGMTMVGGNMFDHSLKARVDALCNELTQLMSVTEVFRPTVIQFGGLGSAGWWPPELGVPSSTGGQNDVRYAVFPATHRLAIQIDGTTRVFDTGEHRIGGVQQQQGSGHGGTLMFTSQLGTFAVATLPDLGRPQAAPTPPAPEAAHPKVAPSPPDTPPAAVTPPAPASAPPPGGTSDAGAIIAAIESLAGLHERGILSDEEFAAKKTELLGRL
jgi:Short C-terminal domain